MKTKEIRRKMLRFAAFQRLGDACACGETYDLRIRFQDPLNPLKAKYHHYAETLHLKVIQDPQFREQVALKCRPCRYNPRKNYVL